MRALRRRLEVRRLGASGSASRGEQAVVARAATASAARPSPPAVRARKLPAVERPAVHRRHSRVVNSSRFSSARATPTHTAVVLRAELPLRCDQLGQHRQLAVASAAGPGTARTRSGAARRPSSPRLPHALAQGARALDEDRVVEQRQRLQRRDAPVAPRARLVAVGPVERRQRRVRQRPLHVDVDAAAVAVAAGHLQRLGRELLVEQPVRERRHDRRPARPAATAARSPRGPGRGRSRPRRGSGSAGRAARCSGRASRPRAAATTCR